jgi:two-component system, NtrC family, response regulator AtoC
MNFRINASDLPPDEIIFGTTSAMQEVKNTIARTCDTNLSILIRGETGTGKEIIARYVHSRSRFKAEPFVKLNCAAIPVHLLESELLGYEKGAFTGANESKPGLVEIANGGTLFLDEIGDMPSSLQAKLLHLLQDGSFTRIGGREDRQARARIICATHCDLEEAVKARAFRSDLFHRIDVIGLHLLPLRKRKQDIPQLCDHFLEKLGKKYCKPTTPLSESTLHLLTQWDWPGNIRDLENWIIRNIVLGVREALNAELSRQVSVTNKVARTPAWGCHLKDASRESARAAEQAIILKQLEANHGNRRSTSKALNMSYRSLLYKLREIGVPSRRRIKLSSKVEHRSINKLTGDTDGWK